MFPFLSSLKQENPNPHYIQACLVPQKLVGSRTTHSHNGPQVTRVTYLLSYPILLLLRCYQYNMPYRWCPCVLWPAGCCRTKSMAYLLEDAALSSRAWKLSSLPKRYRDFRWPLVRKPQAGRHNDPTGPEINQQVFDLSAFNLQVCNEK